MEKKLTIKELAEFINGRVIAKEEKNAIFIAMLCDGEASYSVSGQGDAIVEAIGAMIKEQPDIAYLILSAVISGMYNKGYADAREKSSKAYQA